MTKPISDRPLKQAGRKPMPYDEAVAAEVCERLSQGETLRAICEDPAMPSHQTVYRWVADEPTFRTAYARAREAQMDHWSDEIVEIADDASNDYMERIGKDGEVERVFDPEAVQRSKLRIATRQWLMARLAAKRYGDRVDVNVTAQVEVSALSDAELEARTQASLKALGVEVTGPLLVVPPAPLAAGQDGADDDLDADPDASPDDG